MFSSIKILGIAGKVLPFAHYILVLKYSTKFILCVRRKVSNGYSNTEAIIDCANELVK